MNFDLDDDQRMLRESIDRLFDAHATSPDPATEWEAYRDMGLLALPFAETQGGLAMGHEAVMLLMESYGRTLGRAPYLQSVLMAGQLLARAGGAVADGALMALLAGTSRIALALFEPGRRYRWQEPAMSATRTENGWRLSGAKVAILDGDHADFLIFSAQVDDGLGLFLVAANAQGATRRCRSTPDGRGAADIELTNVDLPADHGLGDPATNADLLATVLDGAIAATCAEAVGAMDRLIAITTDYLNTRTQFGVTIGSFQALQHRAADMLVAMEQARSMTFHAVSMLEAAADERTVAVAAAKALVNRAARFVGSEAIQLHGGMGLASEYPAGLYFQRLTVIETLFGDTDFMLNIVEAGGGLR